MPLLLSATLLLSLACADGSTPLVSIEPEPLTDSTSERYSGNFGVAPALKGMPSLPASGPASQPPSPGPPLSVFIPTPTLAPPDNPEPTVAPFSLREATVVPPPEATPTPVPAPLPTPSPTAPPPPSPTLLPTPTPAPKLTVPIVLSTDPGLVSLGRSFQLRITVQSGTVSSVDSVQVYLEFDSDKVEAVTLAAGEQLGYLLQSRVDNDRGRIYFAAGSLQDAVSRPFILTTITFIAKSPAAPPGTYIGFAPLKTPRRTKTVRQGHNITGVLTGAYVLIK